MLARDRMRIAQIPYWYARSLQAKSISYKHLEWPDNRQSLGIFCLQSIMGLACMKRAAKVIRRMFDLDKKGGVRPVHASRSLRNWPSSPVLNFNRSLLCPPFYSVIGLPPLKPLAV